MAEKTFESQMARLEEIVRLLEARRSAARTESMKLFEEGTKLSAALGKLLDKAEQKVTVVPGKSPGRGNGAVRLTRRRRQNDIFRTAEARISR